MKTKFVLWNAAQLAKKGLLPICSNLAVTLDKAAGGVEMSEGSRVLLVNVGCKKNQPQAILALSFYLVTEDERVAREERAEILVDEKTGKTSARVVGDEEDGFAGCISDITRWVSDAIIKRLLKELSPPNNAPA